ncbi:MAG: sulfate respiration complex hexadecaheme cytochrome HmcA [Thermodesulfobacteriota bacterium]
MGKSAPVRLGVGIFLAAAVLSVLAIKAQGVADRPASPNVTRPDVITLDVLKKYGALELPAVTFLHDTHTDALEKKNKSCQACHPSEKDNQVPKFKRVKDGSRQQLMDLYHENCLACHKETAAAGEKAGPVVCRECHAPRSAAVSSRRPVGLDKSLHYRHTQALQDKCELCHHEYDARNKKLYYAKEKEGTCRYCHLGTQIENRMPMNEASHRQCLNCHQKISAQKKKAGPVKCAGCHDLARQQAWEKPAAVPRMKRNQPNLVLINTYKPGQGPSSSGQVLKMEPVAFDHQAHEGYNNTCRVCHHAALDSCAACHTLAGSKDGRYLQLERAMHRLDSRQSCQGCHLANQASRNCAGCHAAPPVVRSNGSEAGCRKCHLKPGRPLAQDPGSLPPEEKTARAAELLAGRQMMDQAINLEDLPEKVIIKELEDQYKPAEFPHRKVVQTLLNKVKDNKLAGFFHGDPATFCQGCHHNSPAAAKPPRCSNCHGRPFDEREVLRPGMKAAYHLQCLGCHQRMGLAKPAATACGSCHEEKKR